jgi:GNAT superfamily N-acetyltransferase
VSGGEIRAGSGAASFRIREATAADRPPLADLLGRQLAEHDIDVPPARLAAAIDGVLADPSRGFFLLAEDDAGAFGVAYLAFNWTLEHAGRCAWLEELYVLPERREGGAGTAILEAAVDACRHRGCRAIDLEVEEHHRRVETLYRRHGFLPHTRHRWFLRLSG